MHVHATATTSTALQHSPRLDLGCRSNERCMLRHTLIKYASALCCHRTGSPCTGMSFNTYIYTDLQQQTN
jgi:hypothetical protein